MANPFPFTAGQVLTAAQMNGIGEAWTSYTPVIKGGATTVTATIQYAQYQRINKLCYVQVLAQVTSTGATNGAISISLPIAPVSLNIRLVRGNFFLDDSGVGIYSGNAVITSSYGQANSVSGFSAGPTVDVMGAASPAITLQNNDYVGFSVIYEVA
jgi:hypothetical protein